MNFRKFMAGTLAVSMVLGSSITVFAEVQTGDATGTGTSVGHVDKEVLTVTLPTGTDNIFNYYVDPERVIDLAGKLTDDTAVTKNTDGVYFKNSDNSYSSSSDEAEFVGANSVAVDVSVAAAVTAGAKDIELVGDNDALTAATSAKKPALLMNLTVGTDVKAVTSAGTTATASLQGKPDNFEVVVDGGAYKYKAKADAAGWDKTTIKLSGKTNNVDVPSDMTAPTIKLTWTIAKHQDYTDAEGYGSWSGSSLYLASDASTGFSSNNVTVEVSDGGTTYTALASDKYDVNSDNWVSTTWANMTEALGGEPTGNMFIRITDGSTRYIWENK